MKKFITIILIAISWPIFAGEYIPQQGYSLEPLNNPVFDRAHVVIDTAAFNNWLNANYPKLNANTAKGPREHLYYLLCSYISSIYKMDKVVLPKKHDKIIEILFSWTERLGVFGGSLVYNKIKDKKMKPMPELMKVPDSFHLALENDLYHLKSAANIWSVKFPYYFMIWGMNEFNAKNGMQTQLLSISTGASKDNTKAGRSQGTLMIIYTPSTDTESFSNFWLGQFGIASEIKPKSLGVKDLESRYFYDKASLLHKEVVIWQSKAGSFALAYLGMDGTYQINRQHFLDFITQFKNK